MEYRMRIVRNEAISNNVVGECILGPCSPMMFRRLPSLAFRRVVRPTTSHVRDWSVLDGIPWQFVRFSEDYTARDCFSGLGTAQEHSQLPTAQVNLAMLITPRVEDLAEAGS
jgi:hypothetical protein